MNGKKRMTAILMTAAMLLGSVPVQAESNEVLVTTTDELIAALEHAAAGDEIILREGVYQNDEWLGEWAAFFSRGEGTAEQPIILRSEDPEHPATISGVSTESKNCLYIFGDYWVIQDLKITNSGKGIMLDNASHTIIRGCEVYNIGDEAIHIRDDSSYCLVENTHVHDTGKLNPKYGEGVYIGSAYSAEGYGFDCHYNTVRGCQFGPNVTADHVDIKEYTIGNLVEYCTFDGTGIAGENGGDSFVEVKGNNTVIRWNTGNRNGNEKVLYGFDTVNMVEGWGQNNRFYENTLYLDTTDCYEVKGWNAAAMVFRNTVEPEGVLCYGNKIMQVTDIELDGDATEDGLLDAEDPARLQDYLVQREVGHLSAENADMTGDGVLNGFDLCILKKTLQAGTTAEPGMAIEFDVEKAGYWRMTDGIGDRTVTFHLKAEAGGTLNMAWGCWDPNFVNDDGTTGKWVQTALGEIALDEAGRATITVETPAAITRLGLEVYSYSNGEKEDVTLEKAVVK